MKKFNYVSIIIYSLLAIPIGIIIGAICAVFGTVLISITNFRDAHVVYLLPFLAPVGLLILLMYQKASPKSQQGMGLLYDTAEGKNEKIPKLLIPLIMVTTWLTHLFGGSAGREGVAVQIGGTVSHCLGNVIGKTPLGKWCNNKERIFLVVGMAAGFSGLFQIPLAATFFALEVLMAGAFMWEALLPVLVGAYTACFTSHFLGLEKFSVTITDTLVVNGQTMWKLVIIAVIFGLVGGAFARGLGLAKKKLAEKLKNPYIRILVVGIILTVLLFVLHTGRYSGLGTNLISAAFTGGEVFAYDFALKFALTILTLAAGYQGGEVTPLFSIGATLGIVLAGIFGLPVMIVAALGYAAVFGGATNTLFAPILIGIEVFGAEHAVPFALVCIIAYACNTNASIYGKQKRKLWMKDV